MRIDLDNFELYCFKVGVYFERDVNDHVTISPVVDGFL